MRTTINLDDDVERAARAMAKAEHRSLGAVVSDLCRASLAPRPDAIRRGNGFPVFAVSSDATPITPEMVRAALEE